MKNYKEVGFKDFTETEERAIDYIPKNCEHLVIEVPTQYRLIYLIAFIMGQPSPFKVIVFVSNCETVNFFHDVFGKLAWPEGFKSRPVFKLHGDMDLADRKTNFSQFDKVNSGALVCTDVAARGLDFKSVNWVVNYDLPDFGKDYANRVGRTARIANEGAALSFLNPGLELKYKDFLKKEGIFAKELSRFNIMSEFE